MQTQSHFLMSALVGKQLQHQGIPVYHKAWLLGSVLPDVPLALLTLGGTLYYRWFAPSVPAGEVHELLHFQLFFTDPWWIASHNVFHSLVISGLLLGLGWFARCRQRQWGSALVWFAAATLFHTGIDIFTHHSDGPVFLFPLTWSYRFQSPISYWETEYYGRQLSLFEWLLDGVILVYLVGDWWRKRSKRSAMLPRNKQRTRWLLVFVLALTLVLGLAGAALAADFRSGDTVTIGKNEVIDDDLIIAGQNVIVDGTINGDLVVAGGTIVTNGSLLTAGQSMTINGTVGGTLYGAGASLNLGPQAVIERNLFFGGYSISIAPGSLVKRDGSIGGYQAMLKGEIQRDLLAGVGALELNGVVGRNANVEVGESSATVPPDFWRSFVQGDMPATIQPGLGIGSDAKIAGKLNYTSPVEQTSGIAAQPQGG